MSEIASSVDHPKGIAIFRLPGLATMLAIVVLACVYALIAPRFLGYGNVSNLLRNASLVSLVAMGQMFAIVVGGLDLSVSAVIALSSVTSALSMVQVVGIAPGYETAAVVVGLGASLSAGIAVGLANGIAIAWLRLPPLVVTLGSWTIVAALAAWLTRGTPIYGLPDLLTQEIARSRLLGLPLQLYVFGLCLAGVVYLWYCMPFGTHLRAVGSSGAASRAVGIRTEAMQIAAYTICSTLAGLCGFLLTAQVGSGDASIGQSFLMDSIAGAILGGTALRGGIGRPELVFTGSLLLVIVTNGLNLIGFDSRLLTVAVGVIIFAAAYFSMRGKNEL